MARDKASTKPRLEKLGVAEGTVVSVLAVDDPALPGELTKRGAVASFGRARAGSNVVLLGARSPRDLARLARLRETIRENGAIWVLWPKGRPELREDDVRAAALRVGLVDVKVAAFSSTLAALKLVIPKALRRAE